jgi:hypothetical protein
MKNIHLIFVLLFVTCQLLAQVPKYSNEFLSIGVGGRSMSMANTTIASINDVSAGYWNPAGLVDLKKECEVGLMHAEYFAGIAKYDYLGGAMKINDSSALGLTAIRFGVDDIPNTLELYDNEGNVRYDRIKTFTAADYALLFSYARKAPVPGLQYGGNVKVIYRHTGKFAAAWGLGFDAGMQYKYKQWQFGVTGRDITSTFNAWIFRTEGLEETFEATGNEIPVNSMEITLPRLIGGAARHFELSDKFGCLLEVNMDITFDGKRHTLVKTNLFSMDPHWGFELDYKKFIFFRGGIGNIQQIQGFDKKAYAFQPNLGLGINFKNFQLDYALTDIADQAIAPYSHVFLLSYAFDKELVKGRKE